MKSFRLKISGMAALMCCLSCVEIDSQLGVDLVATDQQYETHIIDIPLAGITNAMADSLTGFSKQRMVIGSIRDADFGLTTRASAITLLPMVDTLDFGNIQEISDFSFYSAFDTTSVANPSQERILQSVEVYALESSVIDHLDANKDIAHSASKINKSTPIIDGASDLAFKFTDEFCKDFVDKIKGRMVNLDFDGYLKAVPGIYLKTTDQPATNGGRINLFGLQLGIDTSYGYITDNFASLKLNTIYDDEVGAIDTTFYFYFGAVEYNDLDSLISNGTIGDFPQYALNLTGHESRTMAGSADGSIIVEGGCGLKPHFDATQIRDAVSQRIIDTLLVFGKSSADLADVTINKATLILPFKVDSDYDRLKYYPARLSPTTRVKTDTTAYFVNITDYSNTSENQGDINLSTQRYTPDITYHMQEMLALSDEKLATGNYDIFLLPMAEETTTTTSGTSSNSEMSEYYQYLMYQNYYSSMYGGYGGYGSSNYYNNYYSYMLAMSYANQGTTSTSTEYAMDKDRFYKAELNGMASTEEAPHIRVTFTFRKAGE